MVEVLILVFVLSLTGCSSDSQPDEDKILVASDLRDLEEDDRTVELPNIKSDTRAIDLLEVK